MQPATRQYIVLTYGKSAYQIALDVAAAWFVNKTSGEPEGAKYAWEQADAFLNEMEKRCEEARMTQQVTLHPGTPHPGTPHPSQLMNEL